MHIGWLLKDTESVKEESRNTKKILFFCQIHNYKVMNSKYVT